MGSIGTVQSKSYTYNALNESKATSFVKFFNAVLKENGIEVGKTERYQNGRIVGMGGTNIVKEGVTVDRTSQRMYKDRSRTDMLEQVIIYTNGYIPKEDARQIANTILASEQYKNKLRASGSKVKKTDIYVY